MSQVNLRTGRISTAHMWAGVEWAERNVTLRRSSNETCGGPKASLASWGKGRPVCEGFLCHWRSLPVWHEHRAQIVAGREGTTKGSSALKPTDQAALQAAVDATAEVLFQFRTNIRTSENSPCFHA